MQTNGVQIENTPNIIVITDSDANQITVTQPITSVIEVGAVGPQGPKGLPGDNIFTLVSASTYATTSSLIVTGSLTVSGSSTFTNIGPAIFSGSVTSTQGFTGSLFGTSSYAITASYALNVPTTASYALQALSSSYAVTASYALNGGTGGGFYIATGSVSASVSLGTGSFTITSGSTNLLFVSSSGFVGLGTTTPLTNFHVKSTATVTSQVESTSTSGRVISQFKSPVAYFDLRAHGSGFNSETWFGVNSANALLLSSYGGPFLIGSYDSQNITIGTNNTSRLVVFGSTGNVSLNSTIDSGYKLDVNGTGRFSGNLTVSGSATNSLLVKGSGTTSSTTAFQVQNANASASLSVRDDGKTLIGVNSGQLLLGTLSSNTNAMSLVGYFGNGTSCGFYIQNQNSGTIKTQLGSATYGVYIDLTQTFANGASRGGLGMTVGGTINNTGTSTGDVGGYSFEPIITSLTGSEVVYAFNSTVGGAYINTSTRQSTAILQADSTTKGFLPPRTNVTSNISAPAQGLMTYVTSSATEGIWYYNSGSYQGWTRVLNNSGSQVISGSLELTSALTASNAVISGNVTVLGTASINTLIVNQTQLSTGSNQLGDAANDFQTLYGTVTIPTGSLTITGSVNITGTQVASSGIGRTMLISSSLSASANSDVLVGLDINPSFNTGSFTGVNNIPVRITNGTFTGNNSSFISLSRTDGSTAVIGNRGAGWNEFGIWGGTRFSTSAAPDLAFSTAGQIISRVRFIIEGSNNLLVGTSTDSGFKLDVSGTGRFSSYLYVGGGSGSGLATSSTNTSLVIWNRTVTTSGDGILLGNGFNALGGTNINLNLVRVPIGTTYTGGTNTTNVVYITPTINNSGGTNILRGIYYDPTLTSLTGTTHRAIETTSGDIIFGGNTAVTITGSLTVVTGSSVEFQVNQTGVKIGNATTDSHAITGSVAITASAGTGSALSIYKSGSTVLDIQGSSGQLFSVTDSLTGSLFSVNTVAGLPVIEAFSDNTVNIGKYGTYPIKVVSLGTSAIITGSLFGTSATASYVNPLTQSVNISGSLNITGTSTFSDTITSNASGFTLFNVGGNGIRMGNIVFGSGGVSTTQGGSAGSITLSSANFNIGLNKYVSINGTLTVNGDSTNSALIKGSGTTSATTALLVQNANASASLSVLDNGRVAVGTGSAEDTLQVYGNVNIHIPNTATRLKTDSGGGYVELNPSTNQWGQLTIATGTGASTDSQGPMIFNVQGNEAVRIVRSGKVGIGTTSPSASLHISGSSNSGLLQISSPTSANILYVSGSSKLFYNLDNEGGAFSIDVDTSNQTTLNLKPFGNSFVGGTYAASIYNNYGNLVIKSAAYGNITTELNGNGQYKITDNYAYNYLTVYGANVGGKLSFGRNIEITGSATNSLLVKGSGTTSSTTALLIQNSGATASLAVLDNGNVGIGTTSPGVKFQVGDSSAVQFQVASSGASIYVGPPVGNYNMNITANTIQSSNSGTTNTPLYLQPAGTGNIIIGSGGSNKVLIGTSGDAGFKLDVNGTGRFSSNLTVTGSVIIDGGLFDTTSTGSLATGSTLVYSVDTGSYTAGFFDYYATSGSNGRAGTVMSFWLGGQVQYTDNSTPDVGNTSNIAFSMSLAGSSAQLFASASSAGWNVKTSFRTI
jgi:hypothetical protein